MPCHSYEISDTEIRLSKEKHLGYNKKPAIGRFFVVLLFF